MQLEVFAIGWILLNAWIVVKRNGWHEVVLRRCHSVIEHLTNSSFDKNAIIQKNNVRLTSHKASLSMNFGVMAARMVLFEQPTHSTHSGIFQILENNGLFRRLFRNHLHSNKHAALQQHNSSTLQASESCDSESAARRCQRLQGNRRTSFGWLRRYFRWCSHVLQDGG